MAETESDPLAVLNEEQRLDRASAWTEWLYCGGYTRATNAKSHVAAALVGFRAGYDAALDRLAGAAGKEG